MATLNELLRRARSVFQKDSWDSDLDAELALHVELATEEFVQSGCSPEEARRRALVRLGGREQSKEAHRDARGLPWLESVLQDGHYALRTLRRDSSFAAFVILIVALGIGSTAVVFSLLNSLLLRPLPFRHPEQLVWISNKSPDEGNMSGQTIQVNRLLEFRRLNQSFSDVAAYNAFYGVGDVSFTGHGEPERLSAVPVSQNFFPLLGVQPQLGRQFSREECLWHGPPAALLSNGFWKRRFAADPAIVGKKILLDGAPTIVAGVLPASFDFGSIFAPGSHFDLYVPFPLTAETDRYGNTLSLIGRMKPGVSLRAAQAEATPLGNRISAAVPNQNDIHPDLMPLGQHVSGRVRPAITLLACAVGVVMLIVCANLSNLLLARTASREGEMSVRAAIGANRGRLMRQLLTESFLLTLMGAAFGIMLAFLLLLGITHLSALGFPLLDQVRLDWRVLGFTTLIALGTGTVLGVAPALHVSGVRLSACLGQRSSADNQTQTWVRGALVVAEVAFACVLLVGSGLLIHSFLQLLDVKLGFQPESAASLRIDPDPRVSTDAQKTAYLQEALRRVRATNGVTQAGLTDSLPLGRNRTWGAAAKGQSYAPDRYPSAFVRMISDGYLQTMGMTLTQGRDVTARDGEKGRPGVIINETMARTLWPHQNPIGQRLQQVCDVETPVIGVIADVRHRALDKDSGMEMYLPVQQCQDYGSWQLVVRSRLPLAELQSRVDRALRPISPDLAKGGMRKITDLVESSLSPRKMIVWLLSAFAAFALLLASLGIYGLISYSVTRRTREIGIRMALGASRFDLQSRIMAQTVGLAAAGMVVGIVGSFAVSRLMSGLLFGVTSADPMTYTGAAVVLLSSAALAGFLPARRAAKTDPAICLRAN